LLDAKEILDMIVAFVGEYFVYTHGELLVEFDVHVIG
jgi:hypothetical protein